MIGSTPGLFERIPRGLFGPLGDPYAELYWELLSTLYTCEFEREPFIVLRPVAIEIAENAIRSSNLWTERRADLEELAREEVSLEFHEDRERRLETDGPDENTVVRALAPTKPRCAGRGCHIYRRLLNARTDHRPADLKRADARLEIQALG